ncbi:MAG TPA: hypothetical protein VMB52_00560 [Verrucomicrobiae bacterium]|nr:hypothetical protein [Verrucomicrobiae bacterium]
MASIQAGIKKLDVAAAVVEATEIDIGHDLILTSEDLVEGKIGVGEFDETTEGLMRVRDLSIPNGLEELRAVRDKSERALAAYGHIKKDVQDECTSGFRQYAVHLAQRTGRVVCASRYPGVQKLAQRIREAPDDTEDDEPTLTDPLA